MTELPNRDTERALLQRAAENFIRKHGSELLTARNIVDFFMEIYDVEAHESLSNFAQSDT